MTKNTNDPTVAAAKAEPAEAAPADVAASGSAPSQHDGTPRDGNEFMDVSRIHAAIMREKDEPVDGYEPVPILWLTAVIVLAMWGGAYLGSFNMNFAVDTLDGAAPAQLAQDQGPAKPVDPLVLGKRVFNSCMACHQGDGAGIAGQFPPLAGSEWVKGDEATLVRILLQGLEGPITVAGKPYNGAMPAWGTKLSDQQIGAVLTYIRGSWGNGAAPLSADKVAEVRKFVGKRDQVWTAQQLTASKGTP